MQSITCGVRINENLISIILIDTKCIVIAGSIRIACYYSVIRDDNNLITLEMVRCAC